LIRRAGATVNWRGSKGYPIAGANSCGAGCNGNRNRYGWIDSNGNVVAGGRVASGTRGGIGSHHHAYHIIIIERSAGVGGAVGTHVHPIQSPLVAVAPIATETGRFGFTVMAIEFAKAGFGEAQALLDVTSNVTILPFARDALV
jgi:hypothetical protein